MHALRRQLDARDRSWLYRALSATPRALRWLAVKGARFCLRSGEALTPPALDPVASWVGAPEERLAPIRAGLGAATKDELFGEASALLVRRVPTKDSVAARGADWPANAAVWLAPGAGADWWERPCPASPLTGRLDDPAGRLLPREASAPYWPNWAMTNTGKILFDVVPSPSCPIWHNCGRHLYKRLRPPKVPRPSPVRGDR